MLWLVGRSYRFGGSACGTWRGSSAGLSADDDQIAS